MLAVFKRELSAYFLSPIGYVFIAVCYFFSGIFFYAFALSAGSTDNSYVFLGMFYVLMIMIPVLTMRLMADDKRQKTDQLTLTAPISLTRLVFGKFLSAFVIYVIGIAIILVYSLVLSFFAEINWIINLGNFVGLTLLGGLFIAVGVFISSLTENQMIAAIGAIGVNILILLLDMVASVIPIDFVASGISAISVFNRYNDFTMGIFNLGNVLFFLSAIFIFLFLTVRVLEKRRWA